jgi:hypothetical protein
MAILLTPRIPFGLVCSALGMLWPWSIASAAMVPMDQVGPQPRRVDPKAYAHVIHVAPDGQHRTVASALAAVTGAAPGNRYAILVAAGTYKEARLQLKPYVDLYGGFAAGNWKDRDVYRQATVLDAQRKGPVVLGADHTRLDGFVITGGEHKGHGAGIICRGVSPIIVNNIVTGCARGWESRRPAKAPASPCWPARAPTSATT